MITSPVEISISKKVSDTLYVLDLSIEKFQPWIPGMFLQLSLEEKSGSEPWLDSKPFSIASWGKPEAKLLVRIEGSFTTQLVKKAENGFKASIRYPFGSFLLNSNDLKVFLAAGAGLSVFLSYIDYMTMNTSDEQITIFHQARKKEEALRRIYWNSLSHNVAIRQYISRERSDEYRYGRFSLQDLYGELEIPSTAYAFYVCGPPGFNNGWLSVLGSKGFKIKAESWINSGEMR